MATVGAEFAPVLGRVLHAAAWVAFPAGDAGCAPGRAYETDGRRIMIRRRGFLFLFALLASTIVMAGSATASTNAYPGKNGLIAFVRANQIYTISPSGTGLKQLTTSGKNYNPVWNPAGTEIAYEHEYPAGVRNIWVMNANGSSKRKWTNTGTTWGSPAWSPNGKTLLLTNGGKWGTLETTSGTTPLQPRRALYGYNEDYGPPLYTVLSGNNASWTTGEIAFTGTNTQANTPMCDEGGGSSTFEGSCIEIYDVSLKQFSITDGLAASACYGTGLWAVDWPRWAPDGSSLLYSYQNTNDNCDGTGEPWYVNNNVTNNLPSQAGDQQADYSPDGTRIVLANALPGQTANIIIESNTGTNRKTLTQGYQPNWQPLPL